MAIAAKDAADRFFEALANAFDAIDWTPEELTEELRRIGADPSVSREEGLQILSSDHRKKMGLMRLAS